MTEAIPHHKAPHPRPYTPQLPLARLNRLGATTDTLAVYRALWARYGDHPARRQTFLSELSQMTDSELGAQVDTLGGLPEMGVNATLSWVRASPTPGVAAALAMEQEMSREQPRASLWEKLRGFLA